MSRHLEPQQLAGHGPAPETRTIAQRSGLEPHTDQWRRSPARDFEGMSSSFAKAAPTPHHVFGDRRLGNLEPQHQELAMDPGRAPLRVSPADPLDEISQATIDLRAPCPLLGFPAPEKLSSPRDATEGSSPAERPGPHRSGSARAGSAIQQRPVTAAWSEARRCLPQSDVELMTEKQVLSFKPASRLEYVGDEHHEQVQDRKHRPG